MSFCSIFPYDPGCASLRSSKCGLRCSRTAMGGAPRVPALIARPGAWSGSKSSLSIQSYKNFTRIGMLKGTRTLGEIQFLSLFYFTGSASWNSREMPVQGVEWIVACRPDQCPGIWCAAMYLFHAQREHHDMPWAILQCTKMGDLMATKMDQSFHVISVCWYIALSLSCIVPIWWAVPCLELF